MPKGWGGGAIFGLVAPKKVPLALAAKEQSKPVCQMEAKRNRPCYSKRKAAGSPCFGSGCFGLCRTAQAWSQRQTLKTKDAIARSLCFPLHGDKAGERKLDGPAFETYWPAIWLTKNGNSMRVRSGINTILDWAGRAKAIATLPWAMSIINKSLPKLPKRSRSITRPCLC